MHLDSSYRGTVHFSSSDPNATLPADYTLTNNDLGTHQFPSAVILRTVGTQTVQVSDAATKAPLDAASYVIAAPAAVDLHFDTNTTAVFAGQRVSFALHAVSASGAPTGNYSGTVTFHSTDATATLPPPYTFTANDAGTHVFETIFRTAGTVSLSVSDGTLAARVSLDVGAATPAQVRVSIPNSVMAGDAFTATATVVDTYDNPVVSYTGALHLRSTDANAPMVADAVATEGVASFTNVQLRTAGIASIGVGNSADLLDGDGTITVVAAAPIRLQMDAANGTCSAGSSLGVTVTACDAYGNAAGSYTGTVRISGTDAGAVYPGVYTFGTVDAGAHVFAGISLVTAGPQVLQASDIVIPSIRGQTSVTVAALSPFALAVGGLPSSTIAGSMVGVDISSVDPYGNRATGYQGTVHLQSSDGQGSVHGDLPFAPDANGIMHVAQAARLLTAGMQTLRVSDTSGSLVTGSAALTVKAAGVNSLRLTGLAAQLYQFDSQSVQVTALDAYGNTADSYGGAVQFTSTDANASLPSATSLPGGTANRVLSLNTGDNQNVTVADAANALSATSTFKVVHRCMPYGPDIAMTPSWTYGVLLAVDSNNVPAGAFFDPSGQAFARVFNGTAWVGLGTSSSGGGVSALLGAGCANGGASPLGIAYDPNNVLSVAYSGTCNGQNGLMLKRYQGTTPTGLAGSNSFPGIWADPNASYGGAVLAQTPDGQAGMLLQNPNGVYLEIFNGSAWAAVGGGNLPMRGVPRSFALALDTNNRAYVAYSYYFNGEYDVYLVAYNGSAWVELAGSNSAGGITNNAGASFIAGIAIDPNHRPVLAWTDDTSGTNSVWVRSFNGSAWVDYGGSGSGSGASGQSTAIDQATLAVDSHGNPWVAWTMSSGQGEEIYFKRWTGSQWAGIYGSDADLGISQMGPNPGIPNLSLILDHADHPLFGWATWHGGVGRVCHWL